MRRLGAIALVAALWAPGAASADTAAAPPQSKKDQYLAAKAAEATQAVDATAARKAWERRLARRVGQPVPVVVDIYNTWTHEHLAVDPAEASRIPQAVVNSFLRCHFTNEPTDMDPRLFGVLVTAAAHFKADRIDIVSGFRAPKYNLMLRKKGHEVARKSQHTLGHAVDFRVEGIGVGTLQQWALGLHLGGVGIYESSGFVHVDVGPVRTWGGE